MKNLNCCGIYKITNTINEKYYMGSSYNIKNRIRKHFELLKRNSHHSIHLQNAYNKYNKKSFIYETLELCNKNELLIIEQKYLDNIIDWKNVYNLNKIASGGSYDLTNHPNEKMIRKKMSVSNTGKHTKPFYINNIYYKTLKNAANVFKVDIKAISYRLKNWNYKKYYYVNQPKIGAYDPNIHINYCYKPKRENKKYYCCCGIEITKHGQFCNVCRKIRRKNKKYYNPVIINDVEYDTSKEASRILGIKYDTLLQRIKSNTIRYKDYYKKDSPKDVTKLITIDEINKKISEKNKGNAGSNHKPLIINNINYKSLSEAARKTNIPKTTINGRLKNLKYVEYVYVIK